MRNSATSPLSAPALRGIVTAALFAAAVAITFDAWADIYRTAVDDPESGHILLVPFIFLGLVWVRRDRLLDVPRHRWIGPVVAALGWLSFAYGFRTFQHTFWQGGAILMAVGSALAIFGGSVFLRLLPAFGALLFLIPVWPERRQQLAWPLQTATARITQVVCDVLHMGVERNSNLLSVNGVDVAVAEACNGMRMVLSLLLVAYVYAFATPLRATVRLLILVLSPVLAVACNVIRLVPTVWFYGHASAGAARRFHDVSGWVMLVLAFGILAGVVRLLRWTTLPVDLPRPPREAVVPAATLARSPWPAVIGFIIVLCFAAAGRAGFPKPQDTAPYHQRVREAAAGVPLAFGDWAGRDVPVPYDAVEALRPNVLVSRQYTNTQTGRHVSLLAVQCADTRLLMNHYPPVCYTHERYSLAGRQPRQWDAGDGAIQGAEFEFDSNSLDRSSLLVSYCTLMPDGGTAGDMAPVFAATSDLRRRYLGAAEVQLVFGPGVDAAERDRVTTQFLRMLRPLTRAIARRETQP